jgi:hypothetical protein
MEQFLGMLDKIAVKIVDAIRPEPVQVLFQFAGVSFDHRHGRGFEQ